MEESGLYPHLRARKDFWAIHEELNKAVRIERSGNYTVRVTCTYRDYPPGPDDPRDAAILVNLLGNKLIEATMILKATQMNGRVEYFRERSESVARSWEELNAKIRLSAKDPRLDRLTLDRDLARKEYESLRQKLNEAEGLSEPRTAPKVVAFGLVRPGPGTRETRYLATANRAFRFGWRDSDRVPRMVGDVYAGASPCAADG